MAESSVDHERRQHPRLPVSSGIIAVLITSSPEIIGSVSDISLGGAKITYHKPANSELDYSKLKVDLISDDRFVEAVPTHGTVLSSPVLFLLPESCGSAAYILPT